MNTTGNLRISLRSNLLLNNIVRLIIINIMNKQQTGFLGKNTTALSWHFLGKNTKNNFSIFQRKMVLYPFEEKRRGGSRSPGLSIVARLALKMVSKI